MFGPSRATKLDVFEYRLILSALDREARYLKGESERHRDAYDAPAWAEAIVQQSVLRGLRLRLEYEMRELPALMEEEERWARDHLARTAAGIPRSKANAQAHHADVLKRRAAAEARRAAYWERRSKRASP